MIKYKGHPLIRKGDLLKATDFDLAKELKFNLKTGINTFRDSRLVIFDANAIGLLRQNVIETLGFEKARDLFLKFGFQNGYSDFLQMKLNYSFESEIDMLASGPVIHTWEGIVLAKPKELRYDRNSGEFFFTGVWTNSYEAEQHLTFNRMSDEPVCWSLMGYASGWSSAFFERPLLAIEPKCMGMGDEQCEWKIMPPSEWDDTAKPYINAYKELWKEV